MTIYSINDLINKNFDDEEIDIVSKSLLYSLIVDMFNFMKINIEQNKIIELTKTDNWYNKYTWTENQKNKYKDKLVKVFYNLYRFGPVKCENSAQEFIMKYGFQIKSSKKTNKK